MTVNHVFLMYGAFGFIMFLSWGYMVFIRNITLEKIKRLDTELYKNILGDLDESWVERGGWTKPIDLHIVIRLHRSLTKGVSEEILSRKMRVGYVLATYLVKAGVVAWLLRCFSR